MHAIANITGVYDGDTVEDNDDVDRGAFSTLLGRGDKIVIHEVHDQDQLDDLKRRYADEWDQKVEIATDDGSDADNEGHSTGEGADDDADNSSNMGDGDECLHVDCEREPDMVAICDTGQRKHYCDEHGGGVRAGHARVEEWVEIGAGGR